MSVGNAAITPTFVFVLSGTSHPDGCATAPEAPLIDNNTNKDTTDRKTGGTENKPKGKLSVTETSDCILT